METINVMIRKDINVGLWGGDMNDWNHVKLRWLYSEGAVYFIYLATEVLHYSALNKGYI